MFPKGFRSTLTDENGAPMQTVFSQQLTEAWRPLFTPVLVILILFGSGILLCCIGSFLYIISSNVVEVDYRYDDYCSKNYPNTTHCFLPIQIPKDMKDSIFISYRLTNFYQNHQRYIYSRCDSQLRGEYEDYNGMSYCGDYRSNVSGSSDKANWLLPCGAVAYSVFNDTFEFNSSNPQVKADFQQVGISWRSDRERLFKRLNEKYENTGNHWLKSMKTIFPKGQRDEHFIVWMRTSALPKFMKTYSRCYNCNIPANLNYSIAIENNYPTSLFNGEKHVVLSTVSSFGGKNNALGISYIVVGSCLFVSGLVVFISHIFFPRKLGDYNYIKRRQSRNSEYN